MGKPWKNSNGMVTSTNTQDHVDDSRTNIPNTHASVICETEVAWKLLFEICPSHIRSARLTNSWLENCLVWKERMKSAFNRSEGSYSAAKWISWVVTRTMPLPSRVVSIWLTVCALWWEGRNLRPTNVSFKKEVVAMDFFNWKLPSGWPFEMYSLKYLAMFFLTSSNQSTQSLHMNECRFLFWPSTNLGIEHWGSCVCWVRGTR